MADEEKEDRISSLPDFILLEIISRIKIIEPKDYEEEEEKERIMTTKEVIRTTSTISKRWQHLWTKCPNLTFLRNYDLKIEDIYDDADHTDYHSFIDKALTQCPIDVKLNKFEVDITYNSWIDSNTRWFPPINRWIRYAITRNVQEVQLWLCDYNVHDPEPFRYDDELFFNNSCITSIKISYCEFNPPNGAIRWDKLKCLCISNGVLDEDMIETILSGSPVLETLNLHTCYGFERIDVTSTSVKNLKFSTFDYGEVPIKVNAPYILSLTILCCEFDPPNGAIRWNKLKCLCISNGGLDEDMIETILSGSPVLETLNLHNCYGFERIDVTSTSVKNLKFSTFDYGALSIKINAPYILSLTINDCFYLEKLLLLNVSSLVKVHIYNYNRGGSGREVIVEEDLLKGLLQSLGHVNEIALSDYCLEVLSRLEAKGFQFRKGSDRSPKLQTFFISS